MNFLPSLAIVPGCESWMVRWRFSGRPAVSDTFFMLLCFDEAICPSTVDLRVWSRTTLHVEQNNLSPDTWVEVENCSCLSFGVTFVGALDFKNFSILARLGWRSAFWIKMLVHQMTTNEWKLRLTHRARLGLGTCFRVRDITLTTACPLVFNIFALLRPRNIRIPRKFRGKEFSVFTPWENPNSVKTPCLHDSRNPPGSVY